jgi:hypothetical protein
MRALTIASMLGLLVSAVPQTHSPDAEGFIRNWLVLAPIAIEGESGAAEIDRDFLRGEATAKPKAGDRVGDLAWTAHQTTDYFVDFLQSFGKVRGEYVAGYALAYVVADEDMKVTLALSTNDQGKAWLKGTPVFKFAETRTLEKDTDKIEVALVKGQNVLLIKAINEVNNWQACARFLKDGAPVKNLKISLAPQ